MKASNVTAIRANIVLLSIATSIAIVPCFGFAAVSGLLGDGTPDWWWQASTITIAVIIMVLLRWLARRAFDAAVRDEKIDREFARDNASFNIPDDCRNAWLIQLHVELHGQRCAD
ncbi:hypothetical protein [Paraburkholderia caribensis]|uniref:hypothetical protein n=1 Tax=Paraburkholderia caribensis TaxID=75105 RepID=UPI00078BB31A|nr:hypothetical protein [Paraburkholderia caribensis]AMV48488.1 hypothetical protein ATN79_48460 [Paraburkholderia caribensis]